MCTSPTWLTLTRREAESNDKGIISKVRMGVVVCDGVLLIKHPPIRYTPPPSVVLIDKVLKAAMDHESRGVDIASLELLLE